MRHRAAFLAAAQSGKKWVAPGFILQIDTPRNVVEPPVLLYGLTASKKIGNAVTRNRARRRLRALAKEILSAHASLGYHYVLIARKITPDCAYADLRRDLTTALRRFKLWRDEA